MPVTTVMKSSTPVSTVSSLDTNHASTAVQSGPYTKAQFQNTMEGSRSVKSIQEVEQLLRDYPAALELFRTGRYKVKVKYESDVERVILVEKRASKIASNHETKTHGTQQQNQSHYYVSTNLEKMREDLKKERDSERSRSRTHSQDHIAPPPPPPPITTTSVTDDNILSQATTSSMRMTSNIQPKVDNHRTTSNEQDVSVTSQRKQQQQQQQQQQQPQQQQQHTHHRTNSRESPFNVSQSKHKGKKSSRDHARALVPYVPNANQPQYMWPQSRPVQHYYSNPVLPQQSQPSNIYMPPSFLPQQNPLYQQPYYYGQQPPALSYQKPSVYPTSSTAKSVRNIDNSNTHPTRNHPLSPQTNKNPNRGTTHPTSFHTFYPNQQQQQYQSTQPIYQSQIPIPISAPWSATAHKRTDPVVNNNNNQQHHVHRESRRSSKHRAHSVETGPRNQPPIRYYNQSEQQAPPMTTESHHHHHHHHHHRSHQTSAPVNTIVPSVEPVKEQNIPLKEPMTVVNNGSSGDRLTIRQLNEIFLRTEPSGRLPFTTLPNILQRFGISLAESDLTSAARDLQYNINEPISARRLVHILVRLGKIAKSTHQQQQQQQQPQQQPQQQHQHQQPAISPIMLPEDREVTDIMTQNRVGGATSTHIHSSTHPNHWY
ncbi:unnamed protein product [Rotaria sordida]|uniref:Uncharacterized protein n=1 Tax=Rotaria sordida TaxID=392033 RepID=A0A818QTV6_9BILA|nr:unnamed protein product [Rotaria sordida]